MNEGLHDNKLAHVGPELCDRYGNKLSSDLVEEYIKVYGPEKGKERLEHLIKRADRRVDGVHTNES
jgi:hypothetical protein